MVEIAWVHIDMIRRVSNFFSFPLVCWYEASTLHLYNHTNADALFWVLFARISSGWATTTGKLLDPVGIRRKMSFPTTRRRIAEAGIEPEVSNVSITNDALPLTYRLR